MKPVLPTLAFAAIAACSAGAFAGVVEVKYVNPSNFVDAGTSPWDEKDNLDALARYLQSLGELLPPNQTLRIEVLDVDLAGNVHEPMRFGTRIRTVRGRADWPRISMRYSLEADGQLMQSGEEAVSDLDYARGNLHTSRESEPLFYEKRMLERWFRARFTADPQEPAQAR